MKVFCLIAGILLVGSFSASSLIAQQRQGTPTPSPSTAPRTSGAVTFAPAKIAVVVTDVFKDEKIGIKRWVAAEKRLHAEFDPIEKELANLDARIQSLAKEIETMSSSPGVDVRTLNTKQEEGARLQREQKFKKEEAEARLKKRYQEVVGPVSADIGNALVAFTKARGITLLLEYKRLLEIGAIVNADDSTDITAAFIADYNSKNPVAASPGTTGR